MKGKAGDNEDGLTDRNERVGEHERESSEGEDLMRRLA